MTDRDSTLIVDGFARAGSYGEVENDAYTYKGLRMHAGPGVHERVGAILADLLAPGATVLDVAAGSGAMTRRILDLGFRAAATEIVPDLFALTAEAPCHAVDLNGPFAAEIPDRFDAIVALEILEHLENPRGFLRNMKRLLAPGGRIVLSTPNADSPVARAIFARTGQFVWFTDRDRRDLGHIMPITHDFLRQAADDVGLRVTAIESMVDAWAYVKPWPKMRLLAWFMDRIGQRPQRLDGETLIAVLEA